MAEVRNHLKRANIDQPRIDAADLAKTIGTKNRRGVGDVKREKIRFLILSGLPHAESSAGPAYQAGPQVRSAKKWATRSRSIGTRNHRFACRDEIESSPDDSQVVENTGGPGRTRTCDQTVMSGQL
jgi:hypothetical protein